MIIPRMLVIWDRCLTILVKADNRIKKYNEWGMSPFSLLF